MENQTAVLQSRKIATNLLKDYGRILKRNEVNVLNSFLNRSFDSRKWSKITERQCIKILNIARDVNHRKAKSRKKCA